MKQIIRSLAPLLFGLVCLLPSLWGVDPAHGEQVLREQNCLNCHSVDGNGSFMAPDLARRPPAEDTPAAMASRIWNHMPLMAPAIADDHVPRPSMSEQDAKDAFYYLYSLHYPDNHGDARRGRQVFTEKNCASCHTLNADEKGADAKAVSDWKPLAGPFALVQEMWNHSSTMKSALAKRSQPLFSMTGQELADLGAYIGALQQTRSTSKEAREPVPADPLAGKTLFEANCGQCHSQLISLRNLLSNQTFTDIGADMWNHAPRMLAIPMMAPDDMREIAAYVWRLQYIGPKGTVAGGARVYADKGCIVCHHDIRTGEAVFGRGDKLYTPYSMISLGWKHDQRMQQDLKKKDMTWPRLSADNISDLMEFINSRP